MITDEELIEYSRAPDEDLGTLRRLERAAVAAVQMRTGRFFGAEGEVSEVIRFRGWPLALANEPVGGVITSLESSTDGQTWTTETNTSYYVFGSFVFGSSNTYTPLTAPALFRVTYDAGYTQLEDPNAVDVPEDVRQAVIMLVCHWYENREAVVVGQSGAELPLAVSALLDPHTRVAV